MNWKKHEGSLLEALSDAGSTPAASTIFSPPKGYFFLTLGMVFLQGVLRKVGVSWWCFGGFFVVDLW